MWSFSEVCILKHGQYKNLPKKDLGRFLYTLCSEPEFHSLETHGFPTLAPLTAFLHGELPFPDPFPSSASGILSLYKIKIPQCKTRVFLFLCSEPDLNWRHLPLQGSALPTELSEQMRSEDRLCLLKQARSKVRIYTNLVRAPFKKGFPI